MTHPANKRRTQNAAARRRELESLDGGAERGKTFRRSPIGERLDALRRKRMGEGDGSTR